MAAAFRESIDRIRSEADLRGIVAALERNDIEAAIRSVFVDRAAFAPLEDSIAAAYRAGGATAAASFPRIVDRSGAALIVRFDPRNERAERWLRNYSSTQVQGIIIPDQIAGLRTAIQAGYARGDGPRRIARDLIGDWDRTRGRRVNGVLGLTNAQVGYVTTAREELTSGNLRKFLTRERRDKRFDRAILAAIKNGEPLPASVVARAVSGYEARLLQLRSEMVASTETMQAVHAAEKEAFQQGLDATGYSQQAVTKTWRSAGDNRVRHAHAELNGTSVVGVETPFVTSSGARMRFPGDTELGAGPELVIGCRCSLEYNLDFSEGVT